METQNFDGYLQSYKQQLEVYNEQAQELSEEKRKEYERMRDAFLEHVHDWKSSLQHDVKAFEKNVNESFEELQAAWQRLEK